MVVALRREDGSGVKISSCGRALQQGISWRSFGACNRPSAPAVPLHLLVEGRPNLFFLARVLIWRQLFSWLVVAATSCDGFVVPSCVVPGDGEESADWGSRTQLRFFSFEGPFCKVQ